MVFGFGLSLTAINTLSAVQRAINILTEAGPGAWYDPSDLTQAKATWRRNLLTYSESFDNAAWTKAGTTVTANAVAAPDGTNTADLIVETAATSPHYFGNEVVLFTAVSGTSYTQTIYAKYHSKTYLQLTFGAVKFGSQYGVFNLSTGAVASQSNGVATITDVGGGWYRCSWTATATAGGLEAGYYGLVNTTGTRLESYLGNVTIGTYVWGAQLELGSSPTAYQKITDYNTEFLAAFPSHALYQDSAGTTPVTAVEQPVGRILDKSGGGNHLIQPTATSRPTLSSRYNLFTESEFRNGVTDAPVWDGLVTATTMAGYDGALAFGHNGSTTSYAYKAGAVASVSHALSVTVEMTDELAPTFNSAIPADAGNTFCLVIGVHAVSPLTYSVVHLGGTLYRVSGVGTAPGGPGHNGVVKYNTNNNRTFKVTAFDLKAASDASRPYQRVNTATDYDYDFSKFPAYLKFDGVDDSLYSAASVDFTSTDKMTVFAGVHKASDAATAVLVELSANAITTNGAFVLGAPLGTGTATYDQYVRGTAVSGAALGSTPAPTTNVITAVGDIAGDLNRVTKNGTTSNQIGSDLGTGNYGNYPLYVGRRNNASLPFNGRIYQLALKGKALSAAEISTVEAFVNSKTKAF